MRAAIFSFSKPVPGSTVVSNKIARFLAKQTELRVYHDEKIAKRWDALFIVNGAFAFCAVETLAALGAAVQKATRVIWVQNDYTIRMPIPDGTAETPFRKAFRYRLKHGMRPPDRWTTVRKHVSDTLDSRYVNWNMLTARRKPLEIATQYSGDLFYYGAYRVGREDAFRRYFTRPTVPVTVSSTSKKFDIYDVTRVDGITQDFYQELNGHGLGLYLEDRKSHIEFHSPANRFYEMLSAGLPMIFQPEAEDMMSFANIDIRPYIVRTPQHIRTSLDTRDWIAREQRERWWLPFRARLERDVRTFYAQIVKAVDG